MEKKITFTNILYEHNLYTIIALIRIDKENREGLSWIDLKPIKNYNTLAISWEIWKNGVMEHGGQSQDTVKEIAPMNDMIKLILEMRRKYHLNDCVPGTKKQIDYLEKYHPDVTDYDEICKILTEANLNNDYKYGSEWLVKNIPQEELDYFLKMCDEYHENFDYAKGRPDYKKLLDYVKQLDEEEKLELWNNAVCNWGSDEPEIFMNDIDFYATFYPMNYSYKNRKDEEENFILNKRKKYDVNDTYVYMNSNREFTTFTNLDDEDSPYEDEYLANLIWDHPQYFCDLINKVNNLED